MYRNECKPFWHVLENQRIFLFHLNKDWLFNCCAFSPEETRDWVKEHLGPMLVRENLREKLKVITYEHGRDRLPDYPAKVYL